MIISKSINRSVNERRITWLSSNKPRLKILYVPSFSTSTFLQNLPFKKVKLVRCHEWVNKIVEGGWDEYIKLKEEDWEKEKERLEEMDIIDPVNGICRLWRNHLWGFHIIISVEYLNFGLLWWPWWWWPWLEEKNKTYSIKDHCSSYSNNSKHYSYNSYYHHHYHNHQVIGSGGFASNLSLLVE